MANAATIDRLGATWRRTLMIKPDGSRDCSSWVVWLQAGPQADGRFGDLRQPPGAPDLTAATCLDALDETQMRWLSGQDGFAGRLVFERGFFEWRREIGYQPPGPSPDSARLFFRGLTLIEEGRHAPYIEEWVRLEEAPPSALTGALRLRRADGRPALLMRHGSCFLFARDRAAPLPAGKRSLAEAIEQAPDESSRRALLDCEISFGRVHGDQWRIERSTLPYRQGAALAVRVRPEGCCDQGLCELDDLAPDGRTVRASWSVINRHGSIGL